MLGFIQGKLISKNVETLHCVVLAQGVGYEILVPKRLVEKMLPLEEVNLWLHTHVREDILALYGFESENEKVFFRLLLSVSGLGPKTALSLLSEFGSDTLIELILGKRITEISKAPGVGKKTAERLVMELATKLEKIAWTKPSSSPGSTRDDLFSALSHLGYQPTQIKFALDKVMASPEKAFEVLLKNALKELSSRNHNTPRSHHEVGNG